MTPEPKGKLYWADLVAAEAEDSVYKRNRRREAGKARLSMDYCKWRWGGFSSRVQHSHGQWGQLQGDSVKDVRKRHDRLRDVMQQ